MTLLGGEPYRRGMGQLKATQLQEQQRFLKQTRKGAIVVGNDKNVSVRTDHSGQEIRIEHIPTLYQVVSITPAAGVSSSSSSTDPTASVYKNIKIKQVDASNGTTAGPALEVAIAETS